MSSPTTALQYDAIAPFTHIFLSLELLETSDLSEDHRAYVAVIRKNVERLQLLMQQNLLE